MAQSIDSVISSLEKWFAKAPQLPKGGKDFIVGVTPWAALIVGIFFLVIGGFALVGGAVVSPFAALGGGAGAAATLLLAAVVIILLGILYIISFKPLKNRLMKGWKLLFFGEVLMIIHSLISFDVVSALFSFLLGFYILFQIKSYYK